MEVLVARHAAALVREALDDTRVVAVLGARQAGKSTLAAQIASSRGMRVVSLDADGPRTRAVADPGGFIADLGPDVLIDEVQRAPGLLLAIKMAVDADPRPGQFLLAGSANLLAMRQVIDALPGRMEVVTLHPFSQMELASGATNVVDHLFSAQVPPGDPHAGVGRYSFSARACAGGFPEALGKAPRRRDAWFASYLDAVVARDLGDASAIRRTEEVPRLLRAIAARTGSQMSWAGLGRDLRMDGKTVASHAQALTTLYLLTTLPAWRPGLGSREIAAPKVHIADPGLLAHLLNADEARIVSDDQIAGMVFENFCATEILRHLSWSETRARAYHYRDVDRRLEVDLLLERADGALVGIEMKASATIDDRDVRGLRRLVALLGDRVQAGVVLYSGAIRLPLGDRLWAMPISGLWAV